MKEGQYISSFAVCPFYNKESSHKIFCEGISDGSFIHLSFGSSTECRKHKDNYCQSNRHYNECPIAKMLSELIEDNYGNTISEKQ